MAAERRTCKCVRRFRVRSALCARTDSHVVCQVDAGAQDGGPIGLQRARLQHELGPRVMLIRRSMHVLAFHGAFERAVLGHHVRAHGARPRPRNAVSDAAYGSLVFPAAEHRRRELLKWRDGQQVAQSRVWERLHVGGGVLAAQHHERREQPAKSVVLRQERQYRVRGRERVWTDAARARHGEEDLISGDGARRVQSGAACGRDARGHRTDAGGVGERQRDLVGPRVLLRACERGRLERERFWSQTQLLDTKQREKMTERAENV
eukprot:6206055-Pleurochrysis_carterae.AAC.3